MPDTIANWLIETIRPLMRAGDISAIYIGDVIEAAPQKKVVIMKMEKYPQARRIREA